MLKKITYSMFIAWLSCRQKFDYRYNRCIVPVENMTALSFGSGVHTGLETWFKTGDAKLAVEMTSRADLSDVDNAKAQALVDGYCYHYDTEAFTVIDIEHEFATPLTNPTTGRKSRTWELSGKIDGIIEQDGELFILEHKTTSKADGDYLDRIEIDMQLVFYALAVQETFGRPVAGALYDILEKPAIRLKTNETIEAFKARLHDDITHENYVRRLIRFAPGFLTQRHKMIWAVCREIAHGTVCPNTSECLKYGACPYLRLCRAFGNVDCCSDFYTTRAPHEELNHV